LVGLHFQFSPDEKVDGVVETTRRLALLEDGVYVVNQGPKQRPLSSL